MLTLTQKMISIFFGGPLGFLHKNAGNMQLIAAACGALPPRSCGFRPGELL